MLTTRNRNLIRLLEAHALKRRRGKQGVTVSDATLVEFLSALAYPGKPFEPGPQFSSPYVYVVPDPIVAGEW